MINKHSASNTPPVDQERRRILKVSLFAGIAFLNPVRVLAAIPDFSAPERSLSLYNPTTHETVSTVYWYNGSYVKDALEDINRIMRDHRTNEIKPIDKDLLNVMYFIKKKLQVNNPFHVISGYRCQKTNELLRRRGRKAARNSFHLTGQAADIRLPDYRLRALKTAALEIKAGGVGYNPSENFVHIDVGPIRYWSYKRKSK